MDSKYCDLETVIISTRNDIIQQNNDLDCKEVFNLSIAANTKGTIILGVAKKINNIRETYKNLEFNKREFFIFDNSVKSNINGTNIFKMVNGFNTETGNKLSTAFKILSKTGMMFGAIGVVTDIYSLFVPQEDPMKKELQRINNTLIEIKNEIKSLQSNITIQLGNGILVGNIDGDKLNFQKSLSEINTYTTEEFKKKCIAVDGDQVYKLIFDAISSIDMVLNDMSLDNKNSYIHRNLELIENRAKEYNYDLFNLLIDINNCYYKYLEEIENIVISINKIILECKDKISDDHYIILLDIIVNTIESIVKYKTNNILSDSRYNTLRQKCLQFMFNKYKERRVKVGDKILIKLDNRKLHINDRDHMEFATNNNDNTTQFTIDEVKDPSGNVIKNGEFIKYGYTFNLKSHKNGTKNIGVYKNEETFTSVRRRNAPAMKKDLAHFDMLTVAEYNTNGWFSVRHPDERINTMQFIAKNNIIDDNVAVDDPLKIQLVFNYKTGFLNSCKSGCNINKAAIKNVGEYVTLHIV